MERYLFSYGGRSTVRLAAWDRGTEKRGQGEMTYADASFPTVGAIMIPQRTDNLIVGVGDGK